jgi:HAD superfamily hydrolase (TIGR01459 family)
MSSPAVLSRFTEVADRYDVLFCDVWGVIHNGRESFPAACEALARFRQTRGPVVLVSNSPRPSHDVVHQLRHLGVPDEAWSGFVTSGDATRNALAERAPGAVWAVGPARDGPLYEGLELEMVDTPEEADFVSCTGPFDDETDEPEDYRGRFQTCVRRGLDMICANPDRVVQRGDKLIYCAGALADLYAELGGRVLMAGKPHDMIYEIARSGAERQLDRALDKRRVLAIGDGIPTDVLGANRQGLDVLFITAGIHAKDAEDKHGRIDPERTRELLKGAGVSATYAMRDLVW